MTKSTMVFAIVLALFSAVLAAGLTIFGGRALLPNACTDAVGELSSQNSAGAAPVESEIHFVDIKNIVITLTRNGKVSHYLLLDLAVTSETQEQVDKVQTTMALIKSSTVNSLTNMDYDTLSTMHVSELRQKLLDEYRKAYSSLNLKAPFNDVMISKMVFQ